MPTAKSSTFAGDPCRFLARKGVEVSAGLPAEDFVTAGGRITAVCTPAGQIDADSVCIAGGGVERRPGGSACRPPFDRSGSRPNRAAGPAKPRRKRASSTKGCAISFRVAMATCWSARRKRTSVSIATPPPSPLRNCSLLRFRSSPRSPRPASNARGLVWPRFARWSTVSRSHFGLRQRVSGRWSRPSRLAIVDRHGSGHESTDFGSVGADRS